MLPSEKSHFTQFSTLLPPQPLHADNTRVRQLPEKQVCVSQQTTGKALQECIDLTKGSAKALSPQYSSLVVGIQCLFENDTGYLQMKKALGLLLLMATPVWEPLRIVAAALGALAGSIGTVFTGTAYGLHRMGELAIEGQEPSEAELERIKYTQAFVKRMQNILADQRFSRPMAKEFYEHPEQLISLAAFAVAFRSRNLEGKQLETTYGKIDQDRVAKQPTICQKYFTYVNEIKASLKNLCLSLDDSLAWEFIAKAYKDIEKGNTDKYQASQIEDLMYIDQQSKALCDLFVEDPIFKEMWEKVS